MPSDPDLPCTKCNGAGQIVTPVVIGFDDKGNPIIDQQAVICDACFGSGDA